MMWESAKKDFLERAFSYLGNILFYNYLNQHIKLNKTFPW